MGDERFLQMLAELRRRYEFRSISTQDFRALVKRIPASSDERNQYRRLLRQLGIFRRSSVASNFSTR